MSTPKGLFLATLRGGQAALTNLLPKTAVTAIEGVPKVGDADRDPGRHKIGAYRTYWDER
jgi:hypothetical protein